MSWSNGKAFAAGQPVASMTGFDLAVDRVIPDGNFKPVFGTVKRAGEVDFDVHFDPGFAVGDLKTVDELMDKYLGKDYSWSDAGEAGASDCDHPEDLREPLPYQGRPADPEEAECGACGAWRTGKPRETDLLDPAPRKGSPGWIEDIAKAFNVPVGAILGSVANSAVNELNEAMKKLGDSFQIKVEIEMVEHEIYGRLGRVPSRTAGSVVGPITDAMTDDQVTRVIFNMEHLGRQRLRSRRDPYWSLDNRAYARVAQVHQTPLSPMSHHQAMRSTQILGYDARVDALAEPEKLRLVYE